jgi:cytochrome c-type biogenesis protein
VVGFVIAAFGTALGIDSDMIQIVGAVMLFIAGAILLIPPLQALLTRLATPLANWANERQSSLDRFGLVGQAGIGVLLGLVWSPCIGPTLGAATVLAAQGQHLSEVALTMTAFGLGIASVLLILAFATRAFLTRWRNKMMSGGKRGKYILGGLLIVVGGLILTGGDHLIEGLLVSVSPEWLTDLTSSV